MNFLNESGMDRIIRAVVGIVLIALAWGGVVTGALGTVLIILGAVLLLTGIIGFCPIYALLKIRTKHA
jgi:hypothetical protein